MYNLRFDIDTSSQPPSYQLLVIPSLEVAIFPYQLQLPTLQPNHGMAKSQIPPVHTLRLAPFHPAILKRLR
eukprot:scaffold11431_cov118-Isochrysis_galbana.AAC.11